MVNVRNFWVELDVDAQSSGSRTVATGPRAKDGGFALEIKQRSAGDVTRALKVVGFATSDGTLRLQAYGPDGESILDYRTTR